MDIGVTVVGPAKAMVTRIAAFVPTLLAVVIILLVGWFLAKLVQKLITRALRLVRLDVAAEKTGIKDILDKGEISLTLSELIGALAYWVMVLIIAMTAINALGLEIAAGLLDKVVLYIPNVIAAVFILVLGMLLANLLGTVVRTGASNAGIKHAQHYGQITQVILVVFTVAVSLEQLNIGAQLIAYTLNIVVGAIGLALAIAFGLGAKDVAGRIVSDYLDNLK